MAPIYSGHIPLVSSNQIWQYLWTYAVITPYVCGLYNHMQLQLDAHQLTHKFGLMSVQLFVVCGCAHCRNTVQKYSVMTTCVNIGATQKILAKSKRDTDPKCLVCCLLSPRSSLSSVYKGCLSSPWKFSCAWSQRSGQVMCLPTWEHVPSSSWAGNHLVITLYYHIWKQFHTHLWLCCSLQWSLP